MLIVDIGITHMGNLFVAKEMVRIAHESGADLVKSIAFSANDMRGDMPREFYQSCQFSLDEYKELIDYARFIGSDIFFEIKSPGLMSLLNHQMWMGFSPLPIKEKLGSCDFLKKYDSEMTFVYLPSELEVMKFDKANIMFVSDFAPKDPKLRTIIDWNDATNREIGFCDHCVGINTSLKAADDFGVNIIEKPMCLKKQVYYDDHKLKDLKVYALPEEIELLAFGLEKIQSVTRH